MRNDTYGVIEIEMEHVDHQVKLVEALRQFRDIASMGGDAELMIRSNGELRSCGVIGHTVQLGSIFSRFEGED